MKITAFRVLAFNFPVPAEIDGHWAQGLSLILQMVKKLSVMCNNNELQALIVNVDDNLKI